MPVGHRIRNYALASGVIVAVVAVLMTVRPHANLTTVALVMVLAVMMISIGWGSGAGLVASLWALLTFNYFFIPPIRSWSIHDPANWIAFTAFVITALTVGQLSSRAKRKAEEAEGRRREVEQLYEQLRKAVEEANEADMLRRSNQLKTALLDAVTHDLRTPLTSIKASVTTLLGAGENGRRPAHPLAEEGERELLMVINEESDRLNRFVEEMMTVAQIEGGQLLLRRSPVAVQDLVNAAADRADAMLRQVSLEITIAEDLPYLLVDAAAVSGVMYELLENAAKYSPAGGSVHVSARRSGDQVEVAVEDQGPGVPPEYRQRVFEKFFRAPDAPRDKQGFGMGLAIARGIVEAHGGRIWVEAGSDNRGAAVRFTVPCQDQRHGTETVQDSRR